MRINSLKVDYFKKKFRPAHKRMAEYSKVTDGFNYSNLGTTSRRSEPDLSYSQTKSCARTRTMTGITKTSFLDKTNPIFLDKTNPTFFQKSNPTFFDQTRAPILTIHSEDPLPKGPKPPSGIFAHLDRVMGGSRGFGDNSYLDVDPNSPLKRRSKNIYSTPNHQSIEGFAPYLGLIHQDPTLDIDGDLGERNPILIKAKIEGFDRHFRSHSSVLKCGKMVRIKADGE
jgi:hypothetical protein